MSALNQHWSESKVPIIRLHQNVKERAQVLEPDKTMVES